MQLLARHPERGTVLVRVWWAPARGYRPGLVWVDTEETDPVAACSRLMFIVAGKVGERSEWRMIPFEAPHNEHQIIGWDVLIRVNEFGVHIIREARAARARYARIPGRRRAT